MGDGGGGERCKGRERESRREIKGEKRRPPYLRDDSNNASNHSSLSLSSTHTTQATGDKDLTGKVTGVEATAARVHYSQL